jgi:hypothetical protein
LLEARQDWSGGAGGDGGGVLVDDHLIKSSSLLAWSEVELAQLHHRAQVCCRLP